MKKLNLKKHSDLAESNTSMVTLVNITILKDIKKLNKTQRLLINEYKSVSNDSWLVKASLTLTNAILTQNRAVFILTRDSLFNLLSIDTNHKNKVTLKNSEYSRFINHITKYLIKVNKFKRYNRQVMVCEVILPEVFKLIKTDINKQRRETIMFVTGEILNLDNTLKIESIIQNYISFRKTPIQKNRSFKVKSKINLIIERYKKFK